MNKLFIITLEPIEQRYTKQWHNQFKYYFSKAFQIKYIDGIQLDDKIKKGRFLDINRTNMWKAVQVEQLATMFDEEEIKDGDSFLFTDGWHFGITALKYMAQLNKIRIKIYAYWHAGTWDKYDFISQAGLGDWARYNELAWFKACTGHFVATHFHKELITKYFKPYLENIDNKIHVVGFPMNWSGAISESISQSSVKKENLIVFPHRLDKEKQPELFDRIKKVYPKYQFIKTLEVTKNKTEYYELLKRAKIVFSASLQETFGIGAVEGLMLGCVPLVPDRLSYMELYDKMFRYDDDIDGTLKIKYFIDTYDNVDIQKAMYENRKRIIKDSIDAFDKMIKIMKNGK